MYACSGATDYYLETGDQRYKDALDRLTARSQVRLHQQWIERPRRATDAVAMIAHGLEFETLRTQLSHVHPDRDAAQAQLAGQGRP